jgi:hypothetical protein
MRSLFIIQVVQKTQGHHNIGIFKSRVISKGLCVANDERALVTVRAPGRGNIVGIDVEPEISHIRKPAQDSRRTAPNIDYLVTSLCSNMILNDPPT